MSAANRHFAHLILAALALGVVSMGVPLVWWFATPTTRYLNPVSMIYNVDERGLWWATFLRETPNGAVWASWSTEVRVIGTEQQCSDSGATEYEAAPFDTVILLVPQKLIPCLELPGIKRVIHRHTAQIGPFTLIPSRLDYILGGETVQRGVDP